MDGCLPVFDGTPPSPASDTPSVEEPLLLPLFGVSLYTMSTIFLPPLFFLRNIFVCKTRDFLKPASVRTSYKRKPPSLVLLPYIHFMDPLPHPFLLSPMLPTKECRGAAPHKCSEGSMHRGLWWGGRIGNMRCKRERG